MTRSKDIFVHFNELDSEMKSIFKDFFAKENPMLMLAEQHWAPNADVYETAQGIVVKIELAGVASDLIDVSYKGSNLVISGKRAEHSTDDKVKCLQLEINYGDFYRSIPLPHNVDHDKASAKSKDGFLLIFIPFKKSKKIHVE